MVEDPEKLPPGIDLRIIKDIHSFKGARV